MTVVLLVVAAAATGYAWQDRNRANVELRRTQVTQSLFLSELAQKQRMDGDAATGILLALEALPDPDAGRHRPYVPEAELQLDGASRSLRELAVLRGHAKTVRSAAFSRDGRRIVTASADETVRSWDGATGAPVGEPLRGHEGSVLSAAFNPDGTRIVIAYTNHTARLWDSATGKPVGETLKGHEAAIWSAAFSPDGTRIVTASDDGTARRWDSATGQPIGEPLKGHGAAVWSAAFSPDGTHIVTASRRHHMAMGQRDRKTER